MQILSELQLGVWAQITHLEIVSPADRQKLFACGLLPGAKIMVEKVAPLGCPLQVRLEGDILLSIRKTEANYVKVDCINR